MTLRELVPSAVGQVIRRIHGSFRLLDSSLVWLAGGFGVTIVQARRRYATFLAVYVAIHLLGALSIPVVPLLALGAGYVGVLAVGRAWVRNEQRRSAIVKKLCDDDPDQLPDLRGLALLSALQLALLFPLIFWQVQRNFQLYDAPTGVGPWIWFPFTFDSFCKALFDWSEIYGVHFTRIGHATEWGRHLVMLKRLTFDFILVQGLIRILSIRTTIRESVEAGGRDPDLAVRLGKRAIPRLLAKLRQPAGATDRAARDHAAIALGMLGDARAFEPLLAALGGEKSGAAATALGRLGDPRAVGPLLNVLRHPSVWVRKCVAEALGELGGAAASGPLKLLRDRDENEHVRKAAARAVERLALGESAVPLAKAG
jgi:hypothetical protein